MSSEFLVIQRLGLCAFTVEGPGSALGQGTEIPQAEGAATKEKKKRCPEETDLLKQKVDLWLPVAGRG